MTNENTLKLLKSIHSDLNVVKELVYDKCGFYLSNLKQNIESSEYGACTFELNGKRVQQRISKITPTKTGQFVTIWKRNKDGITEPFDTSDDFDFVIITARNENNFGQFIFPKSVLAYKGIITDLEARIKQTEKQDIIAVYDYLKHASEQHLRAFVHHMKMQGMPYSPVLLSQERFDAIIAAR